MFEDLNLDKAGSAGSSKVKDLKPMTRKQMLRVAERLPQAMVKVTSYACGASRAMATAKYIGRDGDLLMETDEGQVLTSVDEVEENIKEWAHDFGQRKNSRDSVHMILSTPKGSDRLGTHRAIRAFASEVFANNHSYMFAIHNDTDHPHGHLIIKMRGHDGVKLDPRKQDLARWREVFAEKCIENGIEVDSSPRLARGVGNRGGSAGRKMEAIKAGARGEAPSFQQGLKEAVLEGWDDLQASGKIKLKDWEARAKAVTAQFKSMYEKEAKALDKEAGDAAGEQKESLIMSAEKLRRFAETLPEPKSMRELSLDYLQSAQKDSGKDIER